MSSRTRSKLRREDGAAAVEFAIIVGLLFTVLFGIMQYGVAFFQMQTLRSATREAARTAAVRGDMGEIGDSLVASSGGLLPAGFSGFSVSPGLCPDDVTDGTESVTVTIDNDALPARARQALSIDLPLLPPFNLNPTLSGTFRCE